MTKTVKKRIKKESFYYIGFAAMFVFWVTASSLCYIGIIAYDSKTIEGATISGLGLTASVYGAIEVLKRLYDNGSGVFKKKG